MNDDLKNEIIAAYFNNFIPVQSANVTLDDPNIIFKSSDEIVTDLGKTVNLDIDDVAQMAKEHNFELYLCPDNIMRWVLYKI